MKTIRSIFIFFVIIAIFGSPGCKKNNNPQEIKKIAWPKSYLPAYPGSWWIYSDGDTVKTGPNYVWAVIYALKDFSQYIFIDSCYVPVYNGWGLYYYFSFPIPQSSYTTYTLLDETLGQSWTDNCNRYIAHCDARRVTKKDTSMQVNGIIYDSVIEVQLGSYWNYYVWSDYKEYYAKNVGLIKKSPGNHNLIKYFINWPKSK
jgi:hypothetical protein